MGTFRMLLISFLLSSCAAMPKMERKVSLWNGCPELGGLCRLSKEEVSAMVKDAGGSQAAQDWITEVIEDKKVDVIKCDSPAFKKYTGLLAQDWGVVVKFIEALKRKTTGQ